MSKSTPEFHSIHDSFRPKVLRYVTRLVGEQEAQDVTQEVMVRVSQSLPKFRGDANLSTWIYRIATNAATDRLRRLTSERAGLQEGAASPPAGGQDDSDDEDAALSAQAPSVEATAIRAEMNDCIREFIEGLPESYMAAMVLSEIEGFKNAEIAAILGVSLETVKIRLHRAREKLRKDLESGCRFYRDESRELACDRAPTATTPRERPG